MLKRAFAWLAFVAFVFAFPASAAPAPGATTSPNAEADSRFRAFGAWMQSLIAAMAPMNEAAARLGGHMQQLPPPASDRNERAQQVARIRTLIAEVQRATQESQAQLARIPRFEGDIPGVQNRDINNLLTEAKGQTGRMLDYLNDIEAFAAAVVGANPSATQQAARKIIRGGFLLVDNQAILTRGRQSLFPRERSAHQLVGVGLQLYRAMSAAGGAWYRARIEGDPQGGAELQRTRFLELAGELEAGLREGRANLERERAMFASQRALAAKDPDLARILARVEAVTKSYVDTFALGDELAAWLRARAGTSASALAAQAGPDFILELSAFEQRLQRSGAEAAASIAQE